MKPKRTFPFQNPLTRQSKFLTSQPVEVKGLSRPLCWKAMAGIEVCSLHHSQGPILHLCMRSLGRHNHPRGHRGRGRLWLHRWTKHFVQIQGWKREHLKILKTCKGSWGLHWQWDKATQYDQNDVIRLIIKRKFPIYKFLIKGGFWKIKGPFHFLQTGLPTQQQYHVDTTLKLIQELQWSHFLLTTYR